MDVKMVMGFFYRFTFMFMQMMLVVNMLMSVGKRFMRVHVTVHFTVEERYPPEHE